MKSSIFEATVNNNSTLIIPPLIGISFKEKGINRIRVWIRFKEKEISFYAALQKRQEYFFIWFGKRHQKELNLYPNDYFEVQLFQDKSIYGVEMPVELKAVFESDPEAFNYFEALSMGKKRSIIYSIERLKKSDSRLDKAILLSRRLKMGIRDVKLLFKSI